MVISIKSIELNNRDNSLNLLRLFFATFVLISHSFIVFGADLHLIPSVFRYIICFLPVPCFFYVSGYLITASAIKNNLRTFFKKRFARIYPAYLACIVLIVILFAPLVFALANGWNFNLFSYISQDPSPIKFLIYALPLKLFEYHIGATLDFIHMHTWNASAWTLIFEFGCYMFVAFLILALSKSKIKEKHFSKIIFVLYISLILISFKYPNDNVEGIIGLFSTAVHLLSLFLAGSIMYLIKDKLIFSLKILILAIVFSILVICCLPPYWAVEILALPLAYIVLFISVTLKSPKFIQKNDISYGIYVYAWPIQCVVAAFMKAYSVNINIWEYIIICWLITAFLSIISWFYLEKPILDKVR